MARTATASLLALMVTATAFAGDDPAVVGAWSPPIKWDVIGIHAAVMPTGEVLQWSYPDGTPGSRARLWDPATGIFTPVDMSADIFCSGLAMLPNGSLYVTGGNRYTCKAQGRLVTHAFDPFTRTWTFTGFMADGRWYPRNIEMGDGEIVIFSGQDFLCHTNPLVETFSLGTGLGVLKGADRFMNLFPRMHLLTSGLIAHVGQEVQTFTFNRNAILWQFIANSTLTRCEGTSVLLPGFTDRIMIMGGNCPLTTLVQIIDFGAPQPLWAPTGFLNFARAHADALILPDATVMLVGGGTDGPYGSPVNIPELYDPQAGTWIPLAPHTYGRMYHATTVLLPDGRVLVAGQDNGLSAYTGELYLPGYLFRGPRPVVNAVPGQVGYGRPFSVATPQAAAIVSAALIAPSAVTHSVNTTQRYVELPAEQVAPGVLRLQGPPEGNHAPPGYYMLFLVNADGVPSVAPFVQLDAFAAGDLDGNGLVNTNDLLELLSQWGFCPGCPADLDGNGVVGTSDLLILLANWS